MSNKQKVLFTILVLTFTFVTGFLTGGSVERALIKDFMARSLVEGE